MSLTIDQVKKVAKLANLPITPEEEGKYASQLSKILEYIEQLNKVDTLRQSSGQVSEVEPTFNVSGQSNIEAKDEVGNCALPQEESLANTSKNQDGSFVTRGVFEE